VSRKYRSGLLLLFLLLFLLVACGSGTGKESVRPGSGGKARGAPVDVIEQYPLPTAIVIPSQRATPTPQVQASAAHICGGTAPATQGAVPTAIAATGKGSAPYGAPPPLTAEEIMLTQKLFQQINKDRAACGLPPFVWNTTLSGGARLHSWNMYHCGFSHTCPDGLPQCTRIANEGFTFSDCGENIGLAGPYPTPWGGAYSVQESMANEPASGWHHIHLFSTTLHQIGIGVYVAPNGWIWFTEDMIS
jgi:uncharacterized protein YkwD